MSEIIERIFGEELAEERAKGLRAIISVLTEMEVPPDVIISKIAEKYGMLEDEASREYEKYV